MIDVLIMCHRDWTVIVGLERTQHAHRAAVPAGRPAQHAVHPRIRHGVDVAFSRNQTQVALWGAALAAGNGDEHTRSITYWCHVQARMQQLSELYPERIHRLKLDSLFDNPATTATGLCNFLEAPQLLAGLQDACDLV